MSQHKLTDIELDTFARYLWEHGDKRKLEAFRSTFPKSKAADRSASVKASQIYEREKDNIQLTIKKLQQAVTKQSGKIGLHVDKRIKFYANLVSRANNAMVKEAQGGFDGDADKLIRNALVGCDHMNKLDGSYAPEKHEDTTPPKSKYDFSKMSRSARKELRAAIIVNESDSG